MGERETGMDIPLPDGGASDPVSEVSMGHERQTLLDEQNKILFERLCAARPRLIDVMPAGDAIPGYASNLILHAGPPIAWTEMTAAMQAAIDGALVFEGLAAELSAARSLAGTGKLRFAPAHDHQATGAMAGIVTASMPVFVVEDATTGERAFCSINEGLGKALRFGANSPEVLERLAWIRGSFAPLLKRAIALQGPFDLRAMVEEALRRGDECHNRNKAATTLFFREIAPALVLTGAPHAEIAAALRFIGGNDHFFLSLSMAHAKAVTLGLERERIGSLVTTMAGNGREVGIRVSGTGSRWLTAPAEVADVPLPRPQPGRSHSHHGRFLCDGGDRPRRLCLGGGPGDRRVHRRDRGRADGEIGAHAGDHDRRA